MSERILLFEPKSEVYDELSNGDLFTELACVNKVFQDAEKSIPYFKEVIDKYRIDVKELINWILSYSKSVDRMEEPEEFRQQVEAVLNDNNDIVDSNGIEGAETDFLFDITNTLATIYFYRRKTEMIKSILIRRGFKDFMLEKYVRERD